MPDELSIVGFDDEDGFASELTPPLTTIALPLADLGRRAMRSLIERIEGDAPPVAVRSEVIPCELIERASVASA